MTESIDRLHQDKPPGRSRKAAISTGYLQPATSAPGSSISMTGWGIAASATIFKEIGDGENSR
jgi:hypothetical protein